MKIDEIFFLESYGSHLRYRNQLDKSKITFERAISLRDSPFSRHHLAVTLKKMVEKENPRSKCRRNLDYSYSRGKNQHSGLDRHDRGIASMTGHFDSLSLDVDRHKEDKIRKEMDVTHTQSLEDLKEMIRIIIIYAKSHRQKMTVLLQMHIITFVFPSSHLHL